MSFKIKSEKVLSDKVGRLKSVAFELSDRKGTAKEHEEEIYEKPDAIVVLLYNKEQGTVILTRQFRLATAYGGNKDGMLIEACAGHIENGASPEETVRKELEEETGYIVNDVVPVMKLFMSPGVLCQKLHFFLAAYRQQDKKGKGGGLEDEGEFIDLLELPYVEAMAMITRGEIIDAKTVILLQYAALKGIL